MNEYKQIENNCMKYSTLLLIFSDCLFCPKDVLEEAEDAAELVEADAGTVISNLAASLSTWSPSGTRKYLVNKLANSKNV